MELFLAFERILTHTKPSFRKRKLHAKPPSAYTKWQRVIWMTSKHRKTLLGRMVCVYITLKTFLFLVLSLVRKRPQAKFCSYFCWCDSWATPLLSTELLQGSGGQNMLTRAVSWICKEGTNQGRDPRDKDQSPSYPWARGRLILRDTLSHSIAPCLEAPEVLLRVLRDKWSKGKGRVLKIQKLSPWSVSFFLSQPGKGRKGDVQKQLR